MQIDPHIKVAIERRLNANITHVLSVSGGSINDAYKIHSNKGFYFLKVNSQTPDDMFSKEAVGLKLLNQFFIGGKVPEVIDHFRTNDGKHYLILEWISEGKKAVTFYDTLAAALAEMHRNQSEWFGLNHDNYIGKLPQSNRKHKNWGDFYIEERIRPQIKLLITSGKCNASVEKRVDVIAQKIHSLFPDEKPSFLHGDLWSGNFMCNDKSQPVLIDPAVYYGNREMEIAFTHLFGGFSQRFYEIYHRTWPLSPGFNERIQLYNLYPLLVHANLFGGSYMSRSLTILSKYA